jgi:hypothetical protein
LFIYIKGENKEILRSLFTAEVSDQVIGRCIFIRDNTPAHMKSMYEQAVAMLLPISSFVFSFKVGDVCCPQCSVAIHNAKRNVEDPLSKSRKACAAEIDEILAKIVVAKAEKRSLDVVNDLQNILLSLYVYQRAIEEFLVSPCLSVSRIVDFEFGEA